MSKSPPTKYLLLSIACVIAIAMAWLALQKPRLAVLPAEIHPTEAAPVSSDRIHSSSSESTAELANSSQANQPEGSMAPKNSEASTAAPPSPPALIRRSQPINAEFVATLATGPEALSFVLPDGRTASGIIEQRTISNDGAPVGVSGRLTAPGKGNFLFRIQPPGALTGPIVGAVVIDKEDLAFRVNPGPGSTSVLAEMPVDQVICRNYTQPPDDTLLPEEISADHPTDIPIPPYQNGVIPLQSTISFSIR